MGKHHPAQSHGQRGQLPAHAEAAAFLLLRQNGGAPLGFLKVSGQAGADPFDEGEIAS